MKLEHQYPPERDLTLAGELAVRRERCPDVLILSLSGELDVATSALLERELAAADASDSLPVIVDLAGLRLIDSSGLETLVRAHARARHNGHQLSLRQGSRAVRRLFDVTDKHSLFSFDERPEGPRA
jgi:anti-sigma B factor antagonist